MAALRAPLYLHDDGRPMGLTRSSSLVTEEDGLHLTDSERRPGLCPPGLQACLACYPLDLVAAEGGGGGGVDNSCIAGRPVTVTVTVTADRSRDGDSDVFVACVLFKFVIVPSQLSAPHERVRTSLRGMVTPHGIPQPQWFLQEA